METVDNGEKKVLKLSNYEMQNETPKTIDIPALKTKQELIYEELARIKDDLLNIIAENAAKK